MRAQLPNQLTLLRLLVAGVFFLVLSQYRYPQGPAWAIWLGFALFVLGALTDVADGYLARRWHVGSLTDDTVRPAEANRTASATAHRSYRRRPGLETGETP